MNIEQIATQDVKPVATVDEVGLRSDGTAIFNGVGFVSPGDVLFTEAQIIAAQQKVVESAVHFSERMKLLCDNAILAGAGKIDASSEARNELFAYIDCVQAAFDSPFISPDISECQQRTAEACAKVCEAQVETGAHLRCAKAIRNGAWNEYY